MNKVTVELPIEAVDSMIIDRLQDAYLNLARDLENRKNDDSLAIFHHDMAKDVIAIHKHLEAFAVVLSYYGVSTPNYRPSYEA